MGRAGRCGNQSPLRLFGAILAARDHCFCTHTAMLLLLLLLPQTPPTARAARPSAWKMTTRPRAPRAPSVASSSARSAWADGTQVRRFNPPPEFMPASPATRCRIPWVLSAACRVPVYCDTHHHDHPPRMPHCMPPPPPAGSQCVSSETKLAMLRRKMEGGGHAAVEELRRQELDLLSLAQIEVSVRVSVWGGVGVSGVLCVEGAMSPAVKNICVSASGLLTVLPVCACMRAPACFACHALPCRAAEDGQEVPAVRSGHREG